MNASKVRWIRVLLAVCGLAVGGAQFARAEATRVEGRPDSGTRMEIEQLLAKYARALNASDVQGVVQLYTDDSVLLPQGSPSVVGIKDVEKFYARTFRAIDLDLKFQIAEVEVLSHEWALLRTSSTGIIKVLADGTTAPSSNHELFVARKNAGQWKLARYAFSSALPAAK
jgi:uncharacterized protein (TIGR02246 family)